MKRQHRKHDSNRVRWLRIILCAALFVSLAPPPSYDLPPTGEEIVKDALVGLTRAARAQTAAQISITDGAFLPSVITVTTGVAVTWRNDGAVVHQVAAGTAVTTPIPAETDDHLLFLPSVSQRARGTAAALDKSLYLPQVAATGGGALAVQRPPPFDPVTMMPGDTPGAAGANAIAGSHLRPQTPAALWDSGPLQPGESFDFTFETIGVYQYHDPLFAGMTGRVVVVGPESSANQAPAATITAPSEGAVVAGGEIQVSGTVSDDGQVVNVLVNGVLADLNSQAFSVVISLPAGNQAIHVIATDELGAVGTASRIIGVDGDGPRIEVRAPKHRQAVYTRTPLIDLGFVDHLSAVDPASLNIVLLDDTGAQTNVTGDLMATADGAQGTLSQPLAEDTSYTLMAFVNDLLGNTGTYSATFYVPVNADNITPPQETDGAGWVNGVVYDSSTCDAHLTTCKPLPGALVTLAEVDEPALQAARALRAGQAAAQDAGAPSLSAAATFTPSVPGAVVTGPDGFFAFPVAQTGDYLVEAKKEGYSDGQRMAVIVRERSTALNDIYLTPLDPAVTMCGEAGCNHTSADGQMEVGVPPGAVPDGQDVAITATEFDRVNFLPSGELPPGTQETYAFRFDATNGDGDAIDQFDMPVTVRLRNDRGFAPGTQIPTGSWNDETFEWEGGDPAVVDDSGEWLEMRLAGPGVFDCNDPVAIPADELLTEGEDGQPGEQCGVDPCGGSAVVMRSGALRQEVTLPSVQVLNEPVAPAFNYDSRRADPSRVIEVRLGFASVSGLDPGDYVQAELYIEGEKTANFTFAVQDLQADGEIGVFRYLWNGRDAQGRRLPPGVYRYSVRMRIPYLLQYYSPIGNVFGGPPDFSRPLGIYSNFMADKFHSGSVLLDADVEDISFGVGWLLAGRQRLYENEAGRILIDDGNHNLSEYYFRGKDLVRADAASVAAADVQNGLHSMYTVEGAGLPFAPIAASHHVPISAPPPGFASSKDDLQSADQIAPAAEPEAAPVSPEEQTSPDVDISAAQTASAGEQSPVVYTAAALSTNVSGVITASTTWNVAGSPYILTTDVTVDSGATLTVEPGVVVMGRSLSDLIVKGRLEAIGSAEQPILFTSEIDTAPGQWPGLIFDGGAGNLRHATVRYGGQGSNIGVIGNILVRNVTDGEVRIESSRIISAGNPSGNIQDFGLRVDNSHVLVNDTLFSGNGNHPDLPDYALYAATAGTVVTLTNNVFQNNVGRPLAITAENLHRVSGNSFSGNSLDRVEIRGGTVAADARLAVESGLQAYQITLNMLVPAGVTLTVEPGVVVMAGSSVRLEVEGHLQAVGTPVAPILFTSVLDSGPGEWPGLFFDGGTGRLRQVTVRYGGLANGITPIFASIQARNVLTGEVRIESSRIVNSGRRDIGVQDYGLHVDNSRVVVSNTLFSDVGKDAGLTTDYAVYGAGASTVLTLTGNLFQDNGARPLRIPALTTIARLQNNRFINNGLDKIVVSDDAPFATDVVLGPHPDLTGYLFERAITVLAGAAFIVLPGTNLFWSISGLTVQGSLLAVGTLEQPILFTSEKDSAIGQWSGIFFDGIQSQGQLELATVRFAGLYGIRVFGGRVDLQSTAIVSNTYGVSLSGATTQFMARNSDFSGNPQTTGLESIATLPADVRFNWWGHESGPFHPNRNPDGQGSRIVDVGVVHFEPWLLAPLDNEPGILNLTETDHTVLTYDPASNTYTRTYPDGTMVHFDAAGRHDFTQDPMGNRMGYTYNADGDPASMTMTLAGENTPRWTWTFDYAPETLRAGALNDEHTVTITDPAGRVTTLEIDRHDDLASIQQPGLSAPMTFAYDPDHRMTHKQDERGFVTTYVYDVYGRIDRTLLPPRPLFDPVSGEASVQAEVHDYAPSDTAQPLVNDLPSGSPDAPNPPLATSEQLQSMTSVGPVSYRGQTNEFGSPLSATDALSRTVSYARDDHDQVTRAVQPNGACIEFTYDERGNRLSQTAMPAAQCALAPDQRDPAQLQVTQYSYEPRFDHLKSMTDPLGRVTTYTYDYEVGQGERGLLVQVAYPSVTDENGEEVTPVAAFEDNAFGQTIRSVNLRGVATCYVYTRGADDEAAGGANALFAPGATPVPGLLTQMKEDCGGPLERTTVYKEFDAAGNPQLILLPATENTREMRLSYDARNRVTRESSPIGVVTTYRYDNADNLVQMIEDAGGRNVVSDYTYDAISLLLSQRIGSGDDEAFEMRYGYDLNRNQTLVQDARGNITRYVYDAANQLVRVIDAAGSSISYTYDANGRIVAETDERGTVTRHAYDAFNRQVERIVDPGGLNLITRIEYDQANRPVTITDPVGVKTCYAYDSHDRRASQIDDCDGIKATTTYAHDLNGNTRGVTNALGSTWRFDFDRLDRLIAETDPLGSTTGYTYDAADNQTSITDKLGRVTQYHYDALNRLVEVIDPLGSRATQSYDSLNNPSALTDELGRTATYVYDSLNRRTQMTDAAGGVTYYGYDANDNLVSMTDPLGRVTQYAYDALDRRIRTVDPDGGVWTVAYDEIGNVTASSDPLERTTRFIYDRENRLMSITDALDNVLAFTYDAAGNQLTMTDPLGQQTSYMYDGLYRRTQMTEPHGAVTRFTYDLMGNQLSLIDPNGNTTTFAYDALNRLTGETNALGASRTFAYDAVDNLIALTDRNGRTRQFTYDALDRLTAENWVGNGRAFNYTYDAASQQTGASDPDSTYSMSYDALGRTTSVSNAGTPGAPSVALNTTYDAFSNVRAMSEVIAGQPRGVTAYTYDAANRISTITQGGAGVTPKRVDLAYDAAHQLTAIQRFGDLAGSQRVGDSNFTFDATGRLTQLVHTPAAVSSQQAAGTPLAMAAQTYTWSYDQNSRVTAMTSPDGASSYGYDAHGQVVSAGYDFQAAEAYSYDAAGNRTGDGYTVEPNNRLAAGDGFTYSYDAEGNRTERRHVASGAATQYTWDYRNRLTQIIFRDNANAVLKTVAYTYDVFDRRIATAVDADGSGPAAATVERFVYDGIHIALVFDGDGNLTNRYLYGPSVDMILADEQAGGQLLWPLSDGLGSVRDLLGADGALQNHIVYDAFGRITGESNPAVNHRFAFTGREWDEAGGLYYYRSRYYDPALGRFLSEDALGFLAGDANLNRYVGNNPVNLTDSTGMFSPVEWFATNNVTYGVTTFFAGIGDMVSAGLSTKAGEAAADYRPVQAYQSGLYKGGQVTGAVLSVALPTGQAGAAVKAGMAARGARTAFAVGNLARGRALMQSANSWKRAAAYFGPFTKMLAALGLARFGSKAAGLFPCDPLSWSDFLNLLPIAPYLVKAAYLAPRLKNLLDSLRSLRTAEQGIQTGAGRGLGQAGASIPARGSSISETANRLKEVRLRQEIAARQLALPDKIISVHGLASQRTGFVTIPKSIEQLVFFNAPGTGLRVMRGVGVTKMVQAGNLQGLKQVYHQIFRGGEIVENLLIKRLGDAAIGMYPQNAPDLNFLRQLGGNFSTLASVLRAAERDGVKNLYILACRYKAP
jgi:RHS repeat-associated protein